MSGGGANAGKIVGGLLSRKIGKQKYQLIVVNTLTVIFLGGMSVLSLYALHIQSPRLIPYPSLRIAFG